MVVADRIAWVTACVRHRVRQPGAGRTGLAETVA